MWELQRAVRHSTSGTRSLVTWDPNRCSCLRIISYNVAFTTTVLPRVQNWLCLRTFERAYTILHLTIALLQLRAIEKIKPLSAVDTSGTRAAQWQKQRRVFCRHQPRNSWLTQRVRARTDGSISIFVDAREHGEQLLLRGLLPQRWSQRQTVSRPIPNL